MEIVYKTNKAVDFDYFLTSNEFTLEIIGRENNCKDIRMIPQFQNIVFKVLDKNGDFVESLIYSSDGSYVRMERDEINDRIIRSFANVISENKLYIYKKTPGNEMNPATFLKVIEIPKLCVTDQMFTIKNEYI